MRICFGLLLTVGLVLTLWSVAYADDPVTIKGQVICAKCGLGKEKACMTVVLEKKGDKEILYYFDKDSDKKYHKEICQEAKDGSVTGEVTEKDGKKTIKVSKVEYAK
jgi:RecG-like helicase